MNKAKPHVHKYYRVILGKNRVVYKNGKRHLERQAGFEVFKCAVLNCTRFLSRELVIGQQSICWRCGRELELTMENTTLKKPTHMECRMKYTQQEEEVA